jgi:arylsulfatase A-like enzyme
MKRPNILFIHVDQMHWEAMSGYGNRQVKTPAMDRIAADGCSFRASYTAMPQCCPARASWYTGRMSSETGVPTNGCKLLPEAGEAELRNVRILTLDKTEMMRYTFY